MTTSDLIMIAVDLIAALVLSIGLYYPRHHRRDLVVAFMGVNVGVLAVSAVLGSAEVGMGVGLGLFGVLSIIRLRSSEISQREVAYYFAALAIGLINGLPNATVWVPLVLTVLIVAVLAVIDHPAVFRTTRFQMITLDRAITDEDELRAELEERLGAEVLSLTPQRVDLVNDTTAVEVRYRLRTGAVALAGAQR